MHQKYEAARVDFCTVVPLDALVCVTSNEISREELVSVVVSCKVLDDVPQPVVVVQDSCVPASLKDESIRYDVFVDHPEFCGRHVVVSETIMTAAFDECYDNFSGLCDFEKLSVKDSGSPLLGIGDQGYAYHCFVDDNVDPNEFYLKIMYMIPRPSLLIIEGYVGGVLS